MNTKKLLSAVCIAALAIIGLQADRVSAQDETEPPPDKGGKDPVELVISYGDGVEARLSSHRGLVEPVSLRPNQLVPFSLQFPGDKARTPVALAALDGGEIIPMASVTDLAVSGKGEFTFNYKRADDLVVDDDGIVRFGFQSNQGPGVYRVVVQLPEKQYILQFHVVDPANSSRPPWHREVEGPSK